jgi:hypothetical protein
MRIWTKYFFLRVSIFIFFYGSFELGNTTNMFYTIIIYTIIHFLFINAQIVELIQYRYFPQAKMIKKLFSVKKITG